MTDQTQAVREWRDVANQRAPLRESGNPRVATADYLNALERKAALLDMMAERAIVTHHEKGSKLGGQFLAGARDWDWTECRICLATWSDKQEPCHADGCMLSEYEALK